MKALASRFIGERRGAVAVIFALCLVPMILLVALSVDYAFYVQARGQTSLAADAAATHATREADAVYTYELAKGVSDTVAQSDAETAGISIGKSWFDAQLGVTPTSNVPDPTVSVTGNASGAAGFTATVNFTGTYPPFFDSLVHSSQPWHLDGSAAASSSYNYVEILMLLDNSGSMLIGAEASDIQAIEDLSVCPPSTIDTSFDGNGWGAFDQTSPPATVINQSNGESAFLHYTPGTSYTSGTYTVYNPGTCASGWTGRGGSPYAPCAFACHTTTNTIANNAAYSNDYYGYVRQSTNPVITLRIDVLDSAVSQVISSMRTDEQAPNQFSIGLYDFNVDVAPVYPNSSSQEASTDLASAETAIQNDAVQILPNVSSSCCETDFVTSVKDLISGTYSTSVSGTSTENHSAGTNYRSKLVAGSTTNAGNSQTTPQKDVFIVTDGMEDISLNGTRIEGEMTGISAENSTNAVIPNNNSTNTPAVCQALKNLNFTVYVLYIDYLPLANVFYQTTQDGTQQSTAYTQVDYPNTGSFTNSYAANYNEVTSTSSSNPPAAAVAKLTSATASSVSPDEIGLIGCASSPNDFFEASSSSEIGTALNAMLHSALTSSITIIK